MSSSPLPPMPAWPVCAGSTLGILVRQVRDAIWAAMQRELAAAGHDLTFSQYVTIKYIGGAAESGADVSATELARAAELNPGAMTRLLDRLQERGLVLRNADPADRRVLHIRLTDAGQRMRADIEQCGMRVREQATRSMSMHDRDTMMRLLQEVRDNLSHTDS